MRFFFITNSPDLARFAVSKGVERIFVDLEQIGKFERQGHRDTLISQHSASDVAAVRKAVPDTELMVRLNPLHDGSGDEIEAVLGSGPDLLMLPMFRSVEEVERFVALVKGRVRVCALVETADAMEAVGDIAALSGVDELHIGLNDLSLDLGLDFMFEPLALGMVDDMARQIRAAGKPFGIGGLARADEGLLPARLLMGEHVRLGSSAAILSRTFHRRAESVAAIEREMDFGGELDCLRLIEDGFLNATNEQIELNRAEVWRRIAEIKASLKGAD